MIGRILPWPMLRRTGITLALAVSAAVGMIAFRVLPAASACSNANHCYTIAVIENGHNNGVDGKIYIQCLSSPNDSEFVNAEMWDLMSGGSYWVEVGVKDGGGNDGNFHNRAWFWADKRPSGGYNEHYPGLNEAGLDTSYPAGIVFNGDDSQAWSVFGGNSFVNMGESTSQPNNTSYEEAGTEYTGGNLRDKGSVGGLTFTDSNGSVLSWGSGGFVNISGPRNYVPGTYDSGISKIIWSGPC